MKTFLKAQESTRSLDFPGHFSVGIPGTSHAWREWNPAGSVDRESYSVWPVIDSRLVISDVSAATCVVTLVSTYTVIIVLFDDIRYVGWCGLLSKIDVRGKANWTANKGISIL